MIPEINNFKNTLSRLLFATDTLWFSNSSSRARVCMCMCVCVCVSFFFFWSLVVSQRYFILKLKGTHRGNYAFLILDAAKCRPMFNSSIERHVQQLATGKLYLWTKTSFCVKKSPLFSIFFTQEYTTFPFPHLRKII